MLWVASANQTTAQSPSNLSVQVIVNTARDSVVTSAWTEVWWISAGSNGIFCRICCGQWNLISFFTWPLEAEEILLYKWVWSWLLGQHQLVAPHNGGVRIGEDDLTTMVWNMFPGDGNLSSFYQPHPTLRSHYQPPHSAHTNLWLLYIPTSYWTISESSTLRWRKWAMCSQIYW